MRQDLYKGMLHEKVVIAPFGRTTVYFARTGNYFTKTKAVLPKRETIYQKGEPFKVINDDTGYSEITLTFTIKESSVPQVLGGKRISQSEFEKD
ncbi:hypothetical protein [Ignavibacterium album]|uniref:hypothetical protein n=1 Tax=Ignavibacterium album TaxID=591197 RepID=UPI0035B99C26